MAVINRKYLIDADGRRGEEIDLIPIGNVKSEIVRVEIQHREGGSTTELETHSTIKLGGSSTNNMPVSYTITRVAFLDRFTTEELVAIDLASIGETLAAASTRVFMLKIKSASYIDLSRNDTRDEVLSLIRLDLITDIRADEILNAPINEIER